MTRTHRIAYIPLTGVCIRILCGGIERLRGRLRIDGHEKPSLGSQTMLGGLKEAPHPDGGLSLLHQDRRGPRFIAIKIAP